METTKNLPRDTFLYLLAIVTLIVSAISFGTLLFQYINIYFPDVLSDYYWSSNMFYDFIRRALAALVVVFPVYLWVSWFLNKDTKEFPEKSELKIRKWLLHLTVFAAILVIIGDLVVLIQIYLNGELTTRFLLKVASIFFIAGATFYHYFLQLRIPKKNTSKIMSGSKFFMIIIVGIIIATIIFGFFVAGSPKSRRLERLDERRIMDLSTIQNQVINYWQFKSKLPADLSALTDLSFGISIPNDPETNSSYEYKVMSKLKFQLCATFDTTNVNSLRTKDRIAKPISVSMEISPDGSLTWQHESGRVCFERTIDPEIFKPIK